MNDVELMNLIADIQFHLDEARKDIDKIVKNKLIIKLKKRN